MIAPPNRTLIDDLLAEQQQLTAVERFARKHERGDVPAQARYYRDLIPFDRPKIGQQYAFAVDLDACTGCKACVSACHSLNGLADEEVWRNVGLIHGRTALAPYQQTVTTACHHCVDPACLNGCPVDAYDKDEVTGIVRHLDDQCIGCQYCVLKCPYDVPKYSKKLGIVRKCDMCSSRLGAGEAPACVQACPNAAIRIELIDKEEVSRAAKPGERLVPGAFSSEYTKPTTRFHTRREMPSDTRAADASELRPEHAHPPLVWMLVLTQLSVGAFAMQLALGAWLPLQFGRTQSMIALLTGLTGIVASTLHLGRPLYAWRAVIGLRHSWLSREIVGFGVFAGFAAATAVLLPVASGLLGVDWIAWLRMGALFGAVGSGFASVCCSVKIYEDTRREFWSLARTGGKFFGTTLILGLATAILSNSLADGSADNVAARAMAALLIFVSGVKLLAEARTFRHLRASQHTAMRRSALLMAGPLVEVSVARFTIGAVGGLLLPLLVLLGGTSPALASGILLLCAAGELAERHLFFRAVIAPKMPGGISA